MFIPETNISQEFVYRAVFTGHRDGERRPINTMYMKVNIGKGDGKGKGELYRKGEKAHDRVVWRGSVGCLCSLRT